MHSFLTLDQGPGFVGWSGQVGDTIVCVMTPQVLNDASVKRVARALVQRQGGDCGACDNLNCPLRKRKQT